MIQQATLDEMDDTATHHVSLRACSRQWFIGRNGMSCSTSTEHNTGYFGQLMTAFSSMQTSAQEDSGMNINIRIRYQTRRHIKICMHTYIYRNSYMNVHTFIRVALILLG